MTNFWLFWANFKLIWNYLENILDPFLTNFVTNFCPFWTNFDIFWRFTKLVGSPCILILQLFLKLLLLLQLFCCNLGIRCPNKDSLHPKSLFKGQLSAIGLTLEYDKWSIGSASDGWFWTPFPCLCEKYETCPPQAVQEKRPKKARRPFFYSSHQDHDTELKRTF